MLILKRKQNEWVEIIHKPSGDVMRMRVNKIFAANAPYGDKPNIRLGFDAGQEFQIHRPECPRAGEKGAS